MLVFAHFMYNVCSFPLAFGGRYTKLDNEQVDEEDEKEGLMSPARDSDDEDDAEDSEKASIYSPKK